MGVFDYLRCEYPLPGPGNDGREWQTKDTPAMYLEEYTITVDGRLVHTRASHGDEPEGFCSNFTGEVRFYDAWDRTAPPERSGRIEYSAYFRDGRIRELHCVVQRKPDEPAGFAFPTPTTGV